MHLLLPQKVLLLEEYSYTATDSDTKDPMGHCSDDEDTMDKAPPGYPGTVSVVTGPHPPTLSRMWPGQPGGQPVYPPYQQQNQAAAAFQAPPPSMPPAGGPKKRAFICGINYIGTSARLNGCINDARCMEHLMKSRFGLTQDQILLMTDDHPDPQRRPTKRNIFQGFQWLMAGLQAGDSLVFHYSGHGSQKRDFTGEETDGMNETLCPMDFQQAGEILDMELNRILVNPLPQGVKLHAIIDACHSGSVLDLPFQATVRGGYATWGAAYAGTTREWKGTGGGFAVQFSAAKDSQTAADTAKLSGGVATGAATFCFIKAIEDKGGNNVTYGDLLLSMSRTLQQAGLSSGGAGGGGGYGEMPPGGMVGGGLLMQMMMGGALAGGGAQFRGQEPVLSANYAFELGTKFSI